MKALLYVHKDWAQDEYVNRFKTVCEPATEKWEMFLEEEILSIHITQYRDMESKQYQGELTLKYDFSEFLREFMNAMKELINKYGLLGYRMSWGYEFPVSLFLKLMAINKNDNGMLVEEIMPEDNYGVDAQRTHIVCEIGLVNELFADVLE